MKTTSKAVHRPTTNDHHGGGFPTTQWGLLEALRSGPASTQTETLNLLMCSYWRPLYGYIRSKGCADDVAQDMVQSFFLACIEKNLLAKADINRGRFRTFLRTCCDNFLRNTARKGNAGIRRPPGGIVSIEEVLAQEEDRRIFEPKENETPEDVYDRVWACDLLKRVLGVFRKECEETGKQIHLAIFELRIVQPALEGTEPPALRTLALRFNVEREKDVANMLLTARRAFLRLLRAEIQTYALSEADASAEIRNLFDLLSPKNG